MVASSLGVDDAWLRKLVDVVDVGHTKKGLKPKRKCQKRTEEKKLKKKEKRKEKNMSSAKYHLLYVPTKLKPPK